jgi:hypothetical protein
MLWNVIINYIYYINVSLYNIDIDMLYLYNRKVDMVSSAPSSLFIGLHDFSPDLFVA